MGAIAANKACQVSENLREVLAIELLAACQAIDFRGCELLSPSGRSIYNKVRSCTSFIGFDRSLEKDIKSLSQLLAEGTINTIIEGE